MIASDRLNRLPSNDSGLRLGDMAQSSVRHGLRLLGCNVNTVTLILSDAASCVLAFALSVVLSTSAVTSGASESLGLTFGVSALAVLLYIAGSGHYTRRIPFWSELHLLVRASLFALTLDGFVVFLLKQDQPRLQLIAAWAMVPFVAITCRSLARSLLRRAGLWQIRTLIVGLDETAQQISNALASEKGLGYEVVGIVHPSELQSSQEAGAWKSLLSRHHASLIVLTFEPAHWFARTSVESLVRERVPFAMVPHLSGLPVLGFEQTKFFNHDTVMFTFRNNLAQPTARFLKMLFDYLAASLALIVLTPVLLLIAACVKLDGGPALFGHTRIGAAGRRFQCLKFRSMVVDSDAVLRRTLASDPEAAEEWSRTQKLRRDPRVTRIGAVLRKTSLDELPQLINVLRLEMSLVGPRPIVDAEVPRYGEDIAYYYETRPGLTGLWQVSGRTSTTYVHRVQLDTWYVKNWTIWHDLAILAKTVPAVLKRKGAF